MLSDDIDVCIERLALARALDEPLAPETCGLMERVLRGCATEARHLESLPLVTEAQATALNVIPFPRRFLCVSDPDDAS